MGQGPLAGVRVVELAGLGPAPFACMMLAEMGADVLKIDRPGSGARTYPPQFDLSNRGRPSVHVDLKQPGGVEVVLSLVDQADVFVEGFRPGVAERLGVGPETLLERRPSLVYGRMTGWGQSGPLADRAGHDVNYVGVTGVLHAIGPADRPAVPLNLLGDFGGGALYLVAGVLAALIGARSSGQGQVVDAAIVDGVTHLATPIYGLLAGGMWRDQRSSNLLDGGAPFYDVYETSDGRHMAVGPLEPHFYQEFERLLDLEAALPERTDLDQWRSLRATIAQRFASRSQADWTAVFLDSDACVSPVTSMREASGHPQMAARATLVEHEGVLQPAPAPRFSGTPTSLSTPPPRPGQQSREALLRWGLSDVEGLIERGIVVPNDVTPADATPEEQGGSRS